MQRIFASCCPFSSPSEALAHVCRILCYSSYSPAWSSTAMPQGVTSDMEEGLKSWAGCSPLSPPAMQQDRANALRGKHSQSEEENSNNAQQLCGNHSRFYSSSAALLTSYQQMAVRHWLFGIGIQFGIRIHLMWAKTPVTQAS